MMRSAISGSGWVKGAKKEMDPPGVWGGLTGSGGRGGPTGAMAVWFRVTSLCPAGPASTVQTSIRRYTTRSAAKKQVTKKVSKGVKKASPPSGHGGQGEVPDTLPEDDL